MKIIKLTRNKSTLVDDVDFEKLSKIKWQCNSNGYATCGIGKKGKQRTKLLHRVLLNPPKNLQVDHINGNRLDNRRINLRVCTNRQNSANQQTPKHNTSGFKGVTWHKINKNWNAGIKILGKRIHLGVFQDKKSAARAYNKAAKIYFGSFAKLNR